MYNRLVHFEGATEPIRRQLRGYGERRGLYNLN